MRQVLLDTNVVLDVLLNRTPHADTSGEVWKSIEQGFARGMIAAHAVTTVYYLQRRENGSPAARKAIADLLNVFSIAAVDGAMISEAVRLPVADFEDAVTAVAASKAHCDYIVTRDRTGFR